MQAAAPSAERVVKRYDNRKLYDTATRSYVTLEGLAQLIADGHEVKVIDQKTGQDLTNTVLAQVILEGLKERTASIPRPVLVRLVRMGMGPKPASLPPAGKDAASRAREEAERIVGGLLKRGGVGLEEALGLRHEIATAVHRAVGEAQRGLEQRFHGLVEWTERESGGSKALQSLKERLLTLESYIGDRHAPAGAPPAAPRTRKARRGRTRAGAKTRSTHS